MTRRQIHEEKWPTCSFIEGRSKPKNLDCRCRRLDIIEEESLVNLSRGVHPRAARLNASVHKLSPTISRHCTAVDYADHCYPELLLSRSTMVHCLLLGDRFMRRPMHWTRSNHSQSLSGIELASQTQNWHIYHINWSPSWIGTIERATLATADPLPPSYTRVIHPSSTFDVPSRRGPISSLNPKITFCLSNDSYNHGNLRYGHLECMSYTPTFICASQ